MAIDLHTHSSASDGTDSPTELIRRASAEGLTAVALTDHDTLSGLTEARSAAADAGIRLIPGTELSVDHDGLKLHMLVHFLEPQDGPLQDRLVELRQGRHERNSKIIAKLRELGYEIDQSDVDASRVSGFDEVNVELAHVLVDRPRLWRLEGRCQVLWPVRRHPPKAVARRRTAKQQVPEHRHHQGVVAVGVDLQLEACRLAVGIEQRIDHGVLPVEGRQALKASRVRTP